MAKNELPEEQLAFLTQEHRDSLLVCWKIRTGIKKGIELSRIKAYADWYFNTRLLPHLYREEQLISQFLDKSNPLAAKSLAQHRRLKRLFLKPIELTKQLNSIEEELETNIRFEENKLFGELRKLLQCSSFDAEVLLPDPKPASEDWPDCFWE